MNRLNDKTNKNDRDLLMLKLNKSYPLDIGILASNFFNYTVLKPGQAIFIKPNDPHCYISGNCIECIIKL